MTRVKSAGFAAPARLPADSDRRDWHASDVPGGVASEAEAVDELVAKVEVRLAD
jgi:hypothetical protein